MKQSKSSLQNKIMIGLSCLCVMLAAILWFEMNSTESTNQEVDQSEYDTVSKNNNLNKKKSIYPESVAFDEIIQRPLFNETRQPFVASEPEKTVTRPKEKNNRTIKKREQYSLSAVVITPDAQIAILQNGRDKTLRRLALGEIIDGWSLNEVTPHSVQLKKGEEIKNLELEIKGSNLKSDIKSKSKKKSPVKTDNTAKAGVTPRPEAIEKADTGKKLDADADK